VIRVVIDTNVVVSATLVRHGYPAAILDLVVSGAIAPDVSIPILAEYREVLARPRIMKSAAGAREIVAAIKAGGLVVEPFEKLTVCADPDDDIFVECAVQSGADFLITGNVRDFPSSYGHTRIVTPREFVELWREMVKA